MLLPHWNTYQLDVLSSPFEPFEPFAVSGVSGYQSANIILLLDQYLLESSTQSSVFSAIQSDSAASCEPDNTITTTNANKWWSWRSKYGIFGISEMSPKVQLCSLDPICQQSAQWSFNYDINSYLQLQENFDRPRHTFRRDSTQRAKRLGDLLFKSIFRNH